MIERRHHDMGGLPAGPVDRSDHAYAEWERRVDAMCVLVGNKKLCGVDQRRRNIEALPLEVYDQTAYYEKWVVSLGESLIQRGVITTEELARKLAEVSERK
jgi:nitrile hydratase subunit beta